MKESFEQNDTQLLDYFATLCIGPGRGPVSMAAN